MRVTIADGSLLLDYGKIHLLVQAGMKVYEHHFRVAKLINEGILGTYFLRTYGGSIDFAGNKVFLDGEAMAMHHGLARNRCYRVSLGEQVVISTGHLMAVPGKVLSGVLSGGSWIMDSVE